jgi:hypothetical protein
VAETLDGLGESPELRRQLKSVFRTLLQRARDTMKAEAEAAPPTTKHKPAGRGPRRGPPRSRGGGPMD